jgi:hypothetical protein
MNTRRNALALAGILTATVFTGAFAAAGIVHRPAASTPAPAPVVQIASQPAASTGPTWADD